MDEKQQSSIYNQINKTNMFVFFYITYHVRDANLIFASTSISFKYLVYLLDTWNKSAKEQECFSLMQRLHIICEHETAALFVHCTFFQQFIITTFYWFFSFFCLSFLLLFSIPFTFGKNHVFLISSSGNGDHFCFFNQFFCASKWNE